MGTEEQSQHSTNDETKTKKYNHYEQPSVIIHNREEFETFKGHKLKKTWFNDRGKRCLENFLYLYNDRAEPDKYIYIPIIKGKAEQELKNSANINELFENPKVVIFAGYIPDKDLDEILRVRMQGGF